MTEAELRLHSALTAARYLGTKEGSSAHRELLAVYNAIRPLPRGYEMDESDPWCAAFVSAAGVLAGVGELLPLECGCGKIVEKARRMGIWMEDDAHVPAIGDWVLYNWEAALTGDDTGAPDHVGVVLGLEEDRILVAEGNYDNAVRLRRISINARSIRGFVCPRFDTMAKEETMRIQTIEQVPDYARPTIEKLTADGSLLGTAPGELGLTEELIRILVILDRRGLL